MRPLAHAPYLVLCLALCTLTVFVPPAGAQYEDAEIESVELTPSIHLLTGPGGNMLVWNGEDGIFLIDDQYAPLSERILAAIAEIQEGPVRFVLNTHWHGDHTGGNENLGKTGAVIVAHDNVRERLSTEQFNEMWDKTTLPSPRAALPIVTFASGLSFHLGDETLEVSHVAHAHTDGDAIVYFRDANIIHTGDIVFWGLYPFIDVDSGGSVDGVVAGCDRLLEISDAKTRFVPGHGTVIGRDELVEYRAMLVEIRSRVAAAIADEEDLDAVLASRPTAEWDEAWGGTWLSGDDFTKIVFRDLQP
jgi:glyoxylase-like metal-dependent hydrolase (beta-lactamase superfamily II)